MTADRIMYNLFNRNDVCILTNVTCYIYEYEGGSPDCRSCNVPCWPQQFIGTFKHKIEAAETGVR